MRRHFPRTSLVTMLGMLALGTTPALAVDESYQYSCDSTTTSVPGPTSPCVTKPPKERVMVSVYGDFDGGGVSPELSATLAKGGKKQLVTVDLTYEYYSLGAQFRPLTVRVNDKYPAPNFLDPEPPAAVHRRVLRCPCEVLVRHRRAGSDLFGTVLRPAAEGRPRAEHEGGGRQLGLQRDPDRRGREEEVVVAGTMMEKSRRGCVGSMVDHVRAAISNRRVIRSRNAFACARASSG